MASPGFVENLCNRFNGPASLANTRNQGLGHESVRALSIYLGHNPEDTTREGNLGFIVSLYARIAGLVIGPDTQMTGRGFNVYCSYWEDDKVKERRNEELIRNAGLLGFDYGENVEKEKIRLKRNLTHAIKVIALKLTEGETKVEQTEEQLKASLKKILEDVWYKTYNEALVLTALDYKKS